MGDLFRVGTVIKRAESLTYRLWMAGNYQQAQAYINRRCGRVGACYGIHPVDYIYSGGQESGFCVTLINYPRFPKGVDALESDIREVANGLMYELNQGSYTIEGPTETIYCSRRKKG